LQTNKKEANETSFLLNTTFLILLKFLSSFSFTYLRNGKKEKSQKTTKFNQNFNQI
jgi:hypothetical protein